MNKQKNRMRCDYVIEKYTKLCTQYALVGEEARRKNGRKGIESEVRQGLV